MVVRKKILDPQSEGGSIPLSSRLKRVRQAISQLKDEEPMEGTPNDETSTPAEAPATPSTAVKKVVKKTPTKGKIAVKKKPVKKVPAKKAAVKKVVGDVTTLAELCKPLKMKPRAARRILRDAKITNPGRWSWPKGKVPAGVTKALNDANAAE